MKQESGSSIFKLGIFFVVIGLGFTALHFLKPADAEETKNSEAPPISSPNLNPEKQTASASAPSGASAQNNVQSGGLQPIPGSDASPAFKDAEGSLISSTDLNGQEKNVQTPTAASVKEMLDSKDREDPVAEFSKLTPVNFQEEISKMFSGRFIDTENKFYLGISFEPDQGQMLPSSCFSIPGEAPISGVPERVQLHDDKNGYAAVMIDNKWYIRLGYVFNPHRTLIGKLFQKIGSDWKLLSPINAEESYQAKSPCDAK